MHRGLTLTTIAALGAPLLSFAQGPQSGFGAFGTTFTSTFAFINDILVPLLFSIAFLVFIWGMVQYFIIGGTSEESRTKGKQLVFWSVLGLVLIVSLWGLVRAIAVSLNFTSENPNAVPSIPIPNSGSGDYGHF
jgi:TRAP-type C4-dicarboxylate transport system permease small subunit